MSQRAIEIHDSILEQIVLTDCDATLHFSSAYIHQSEGTPGRDAGTVWVQRAILRIARARVSGAFSEFPVRLSDGRISLGERSTDNEIPVPLRHEGRFELRLETSRKSNEIVTFEGSGVELELVGEGKFLEHFRP
jgi:hypothetical protein